MLKMTKIFFDIHHVRNEYIIFIVLREAFKESTPFYSQSVLAYLKSFSSMRVVTRDIREGRLSLLYSVFVYSEATGRVESDCSSDSDSVLSLFYSLSSFEGNGNSDAVSKSSED